MNTIGREASGFGKVTIQFGEGTYTTTQQWYRLDGLTPDKIYSYQILRNDQKIGSGTVRTWPDKAQSLTFFVIGDWGNGSFEQIELASRMEKERKQLESTPSPVRFVLSTGDNIYHGGSADRDWDKKFFEPYAGILSSIPFYATLGNHDGNETEAAADLPGYLDNFFGPAGAMTRWYHFRYADYAEFFALDSTSSQYPGHTAPAFLAGGEQSKWLLEELKQAPSPWRIAYFHHPMFTAGPNHAPSLGALGHWFQTFRTSGFSAVFAGHEHNFQASERNAFTGDMQFIVTGAGGELRKESVASSMAERHIASWAPRVHFLIVRMEGDKMSIAPIGILPVIPQDKSGKVVPIPIEVPRRQP